MSLYNTTTTYNLWILLDDHYTHLRCWFGHSLMLRELASRNLELVPGSGSQYSPWATDPDEVNYGENWISVRNLNEHKTADCYYWMQTIVEPNSALEWLQEMRDFSTNVASHVAGLELMIDECGVQRA